MIKAMQPMIKATNGLVNPAALCIDDCIEVDGSAAPNVGSHATSEGLIAAKE